MHSQRHLGQPLAQLQLLSQQLLPVPHLPPTQQSLETQMQASRLVIFLLSTIVFFKKFLGVLCFLSRLFKIIKTTDAILLDDTNRHPNSTQSNYS